MGEIKTNYKIHIGDMEFKPFFDIGFIIGKKASGKSHLAKIISIASNRVIVWDSNPEYGSEESLKIIDNLEDLKKYRDWHESLRIAYQPKSLDEFNDFIDCIQHNYNHFCLIVDECNKLELNKRIDNNFKDVVDTGRHYGIGVICVGRRITDIPPYVRNSMDFMASFPTLNDKDVTAIDMLTGRESQAELKQLFLSNPSKYKHYFVYFGGEDAETIIHRSLKI